MKPEDVPDEMVRAATGGYLGLEARRVIANVWPEVERQVRERVAAEIEEARGPRPRGSALPDFAGAAYDHAARIARGES